MLMPHPQTIEIFLPSGDPQSLRVASVVTRTVSLVEIPRSQLRLFLQRPEAGRVGLYFLFGEEDKTERPKVYVGQTGKLGERLKQHNGEKDFWNRAVVAVTSTDVLTEVHARFLEVWSLRQAEAVGRYVLDNRQKGGDFPHMSPSMRAVCDELFETISILLTTLGYPVFKPVLEQFPLGEGQVAQVQDDVPELFFCRGTGVEGRGHYTEEGMVILAGSYGRRSSPRYEEYAPRAAEGRQEALDNGLLRLEGERLVLTRDTLFKNPSPAASFLLGRSANGWIEWKDGEGRTLSQRIRDVVEDDV